MRGNAMRGALFFLILSVFMPVLGLAYNGEFEVLREEKSVFLNEDCRSAESCDLASIEYLVQDYKVGIGNGYNFGTRFFVRYRTKSIANLENYAIVQFLRGCVFETSLKKGRITVHNSIVVKHFGEFKEFKFRDWVIDSIDSDPAYYSSDGLPRHHYYKWSKTGKFPTDRQDEEMIFGRQSPPQPELYISDRPGRTAFKTKSSAKNISLRLKTCIYKTKDIPSETAPDDLNFAEPVHCFDWKSSHIFNHFKKRYENRNGISEFCR